MGRCTAREGPLPAHSRRAASGEALDKKTPPPLAPPQGGVAFRRVAYRKNAPARACPCPEGYNVTDVNPAGASRRGGARISGHT